MDCLDLQGFWTTGDSGCYTWLRYLDEKTACCHRTCCLQMGPGSGRVIPVLREHTLSSSSSSAPYFITAPIRQKSQWNLTFPSFFQHFLTKSKSPSFCSLPLTFSLLHHMRLSSEITLVGSVSWLKSRLCVVFVGGQGYVCVCSHTRCLGDEQTHCTARPLSFVMVETHSEAVH